MVRVEKRKCGSIDCKHRSLWSTSGEENSFDEARFEPCESVIIQRNQYTRSRDESNRVTSRNLNAIEHRLSKRFRRTNRQFAVKNNRLKNCSIFFYFMIEAQTNKSAQREGSFSVDSSERECVCLIGASYIKRTWPFLSQENHHDWWRHL